MAPQNIAIQIHLPSKSVIVILVALEQATQNLKTRQGLEFKYLAQSNSSLHSKHGVLIGKCEN